MWHRHGQQCGEAGAARADNAVGVMKKGQTLTPIGCGALLMGDNM